jgi:hypothetical protein
VKARPEREHPRYAHEATVAFRVGKKTHSGRTRNVSRGGLCADVGDPIPVGTDLEIDLVLVFDDDAQSEPLRLVARVVWCTTVDDGHQIGLAFRPQPPDRAEFLAVFLRYLDDNQSEPLRDEATLDDRFR